jgi:hypothetical protein
VEIWEKMEETGVQTQGSLHCFLGFGILFDSDGRVTTFIENAYKLISDYMASHLSNWIASLEEFGQMDDHQWE